MHTQEYLHNSNVDMRTSTDLINSPASQNHKAQAPTQPTANADTNKSPLVQVKPGQQQSAHENQDKNENDGVTAAMSVLKSKQ